MSNLEIGRRSLLKGAAALTAGAAIAPISSAWAAKEAVMSTWGGDYSRLLGELVQPIATEKYDVTAIFDTGSSSARRTKVLTQAEREVSSIDLMAFTEADMWLLDQKNCVDRFSSAEIPNLANVYKQFQTGYSIPHMYSGMVLVYNEKLVPKPTSYKDLWEKEYAGKIGFANILYRYVLQAAAIAHGGSMTNYEPGYAPLMELKKTDVKILPSNEAVSNAFKSEEIGITLMWRARAYQWKKAGLPLAFTVPSEGALSYVSAAGATRNGANREAAHDFLNSMLDPVAQKGFAENMGYMPTVNNAPIPADLVEKIGFTEEEREKMHGPNFAYQAEQQPKVSKWWDQEFKA
ncbi:extracellular solute-binding protein [Sneathiella sp.]|uniref:extracellular solute-binding protein n=1 Tax=Sneathiella sp. TaxID=1964365 RepID=UPI0026281D69|nr:extracellular solute-binding protein [Sneathiella sp.]MDF2368584.1 extracellular solute-binding protein [Sneathiella sp.]